jgi:photosynthetic reaction center H subunit
MYNAYFFGIVDPTDVIFSAFVLFFIGLVLYLRREDRREGYPLEDEATGRLEPAGGLFFTARPKTFILPHGQGTLTKPNNIRESQDVAARPVSRAPGSPLEPTGDPMLAGVGPGAYAHRAKRPDVMMNGAPKIAPLRVSPGFSIGRGEGDPRGMAVVGADGVVAGTVSDLWIDRAEYLIRYLEVAVAAPGAPGKHVLVPMTMAVVNKSRKTVRVDAILGSQFANAPVLAAPDQVTMDEEERVCAYYGAGYLYATKARSEPLI